MTREDTLLIDEVQPSVFRIAINRPPANALTLDVTHRLLSALKGFVESPPCPAVILTGGGDRFFCAGGDIKEVQGVSPDVAVERMALFHSLLVALEQYPGPLVAAVRGFAVGAGLELVLFSDYVVASRDARFGFPEINHGLLPAVKGMRRAAAVAGPRMARSLLYGGELIDAERAASVGIVDVAVSGDEVERVAVAKASEWRSKDPLLFGMIKRSLNAAAGVNDIDMARMTLDDMRSYISRPETAAARAAFFQRKR